MLGVAKGQGDPPKEAALKRSGAQVRNMNFGDRYEITEMVTTGRVSTFVARDRNSEEPVVVYTFECPGAGIGDLSTASIIARFAALAPSPPGIIVKAGFDQATSSAFITTKMPERTQLNDWVRGYQAFGKGPAPIPVEVPAARRIDETAELK